MQAISASMWVDVRSFVSADGPAYQSMVPPAGKQPWSNAVFADRPVPLGDLRRSASRARLAADGYVLVEGCPPVRFDADVPRDTASYDAEIIALVGRCLAGDIRVFDHQAREQHGQAGAGGIGRELGRSRPGAVAYAHADYSPASAWRVIHTAFPGAAAQDRFLILNLWRSADDPVSAFPLALCERASVRAADRVRCELRYADRTGEFQLLRGADHHRWGCFPRMRATETLVFVSFDSAHEEDSAVFHCAVATDPSPEARRRSIESRCVVRLRHWRTP
ncbi:hypothetical protein G3580_17340 [Nitrogeniibacter mangrovi]|uniref:Methyltransferase n=1 Tax=Nitrogeniibacter mangrovi TaxID=2016596 RepID=A0A6C1B664_9RHOO|nr:CmcJ/NvfI family oxidoreductase [Nitrogeniibacter mangrovi]QID19226.1 hypothetical protein G3580_17340 [Nitrogeniibacter mangrovi]